MINPAHRTGYDQGVINSQTGVIEPLRTIPVTAPDYTVYKIVIKIVGTMVEDLEPTAIVPHAGRNPFG